MKVKPIPAAVCLVNLPLRWKAEVIFLKNGLVLPFVPVVVDLVYGNSVTFLDCLICSINNFIALVFHWTEILYQSEITSGHFVYILFISFLKMLPALVLTFSNTHL